LQTGALVRFAALYAVVASGLAALALAVFFALSGAKFIAGALFGVALFMGAVAISETEWSIELAVNIVRVGGIALVVATIASVALLVLA
jgi:hypothetical protein